MIKAGGITIATMPLLRAKELAYMLGKARVQLAVCDHRLLAELEQANTLQPGLRAIIPMGGDVRKDDLYAPSCRRKPGSSPPMTAAPTICA